MSTSSRDKELERALGHAFRDPSLLETALTHASLAQERGGTRGNERLEFLGDAVLDLTISEALFEVHPGWSEGALSRARAELVNTRSLARRSGALELGQHARLGRSEVASRGGEKESIRANLLEAVLAALYLDGGLLAVRRLVQQLFPEAFDPAGRPPARDPKTRLNEWGVLQSGGPPRYLRRRDAGEAAGDERFEVEVEFGGEIYGRASGRTWRAAERGAAEQALERLGVDDDAG